MSSGCLCRAMQCCRLIHALRNLGRLLVSYFKLKYSMSVLAHIMRLSGARERRGGGIERKSAAPEPELETVCGYVRLSMQV